MAVQVNREKCTGRGLCVDACPVEAIGLENDKAKVDETKCMECGQCDPESGRHCAILAVTTFHRAIANYLLAP